MASEEVVDRLIQQLERGTERQVATAGSAVKRVAAERDLLGSAEEARDLLSTALKGEKEALDRVFGGSCERIGRLRLALDRVTISDMHANDKRWQNLRDIVETIELVLKDLGTFKPWVPPSARAPESLSYRGLRRRFSPGRRVHLKPEVEGGEVLSFEVAPALPAGLELSSTTGVISGVLQPLLLVEETLYTVVGRNAAGEAQTELTLAVQDAPPQSVTYPADSGDTCRVVLGEEMSLQPEVQGNSPSKWKVQPPLPVGIALDAESGAIHGAATQAFEASAYEITASNAGGQVSTVLNLEVLLIPPSMLAYPDIPKHVYVGKSIELVPSFKGTPSEWSVIPELPQGLVMDATAGVISGAAVTTTDHGSWAVSASNAAGETTCAIDFSVELAPPEALSFPTAELELQLLRPTRVRPTFVGTVDSFTVTPELPAGLGLDPKTGEVSGTPSEVLEKTCFEVLASNVSGAASTTLTLEVHMAAPACVQFPSLHHCYTVGEEVRIPALVEGHATQFTINGTLPQGLSLDNDTGAIEGVPVALAEEATYMITASNEVGSTSSDITFSVIAPVPAEFSYPSASSTYAVGEPMAIEPQHEGWSEGSFDVLPDLPNGLVLDKDTGVIRGTPAEVCSEATYCVMLNNSAGQANVKLVLEIIETVQSEAVADSIDKHLAAKIEAITDISEMLPEPICVKAFGDWMIWMVHRAYLDDPSLTDFNFNNMHMPPPHIEARIAPKLVKAMTSNTHIEVLSLVNANLMKAQGVELAQAMLSNKKLRILNIECNDLDSNAIKEVAEAIAMNAECAVEHLRLSPQKQVGRFFGRPVEEAVGAMMEKNGTIVKLGFECNDAHWRNIIDRALLRNNDFARRSRKRDSLGIEEEKAAEERALSRLNLRIPPQAVATEVFADNSPPHLAFRGFVAQQKRLPNATQLQSYARNGGVPLKYSEVAPTLKDCRARMLDAAVNTQVTVADIFEVDTEGVLQAWSSTNDNWVLEIRASDRKRYTYRSNKELVLQVSEAWALWLSDAISKPPHSNG